MQYDETKLHKKKSILTCDGWSHDPHDIGGTIGNTQQSAGVVGGNVKMAAHEAWVRVETIKTIPTNLHNDSR